MVEKVLGLPHGTRHVVVISKHEESPHREFYKTDYDHGRRAPIHYAATILEKEVDLDDETFFRTFFLVALATHLTPGTGNMVPLEYLGSLEVASEVCEYAWGDQILKDVMTEIDTFQKKKKKAILDGAFKKIWVGSCLPLVAIIYMDHLDFPESSISTHHINYSLPRASHVTDEDFKFVMLHDKSRLTLNAHIYGARPFRAPESTPYAIQRSNYDDQPATHPYIQQTGNNCTNHPPQTEENQDMHHEAPRFPIKLPEELPAYILQIIGTHKSKWAQDISKATSRLSKLHVKRMEEFAQDVLAATKDNAPDPKNYSSPHWTWTQAFAEPPPSTHEGEFVDASTAVVQTTAAGPTTMATVEANLAHISPQSSPIHAPTPTSPTQPTQDNTSEGPNMSHNVNEGGQPSTGDVLHTIGTQTQEKKNRKKRACLRKTEDTRLKKIKVTSSSIELYNKYITARCLRPPKKTDKRPPFIDYGGYHISYEHFRGALKPRGWVDTHTMELYIRQFNLQQTMEACSSALPTKYAFSQSLTAKLSVPEEKFVATNCLREFNNAYQDGSLKSKDMLYFAIPHKQHWILCCINLLYKQINIFDSDKKLKNDEVYELSNNLVTNFTTLATHAKAFTKLDFMKFTCFNPPDCPQQKTHYDCGIFTMLFMKQWDGKIMANFSKDTYGHRAIITELIITSQLNNQDPTWVLKTN
uniref:Ubiquitin-like protease family profile domain-containing protein n=1 Tax=Hordeum vulgare subsp. vulgare TaxID=112509 RepID=A0A8I6X026_HORVV